MQIRFWKRAIILSVTLFFASCNQGNGTKNTESIVGDTIKILDTLQDMEIYRAPNVPNYIIDPKDQLVHYFFHYWDNFDFQDTSKIESTNYIEQAYVNYLSLLSQVPLDDAKKGIVEMLTKSDVNESYITYFSDQYLKYLYDGNSPYHSDRLLEPALQYFVQSKYLKGNEKIRLKTLLTIVSKNQEGTLATGFKFKQSDGKTRNFLDIKANTTLLIFYEPSCHSCQNTIERLKTTQELKHLIEKNNVQIVAIYSGSDIDTWINFKSAIPETWINGIDYRLSIVSEGLYDLKVSPTMYLLDENKKILLKDLNLDELLIYLRSL